MTSSFVTLLTMPDQLFCYGTLCVPDIMRRVSGSLPVGIQSWLLNYACYGLTGLDYPGILPVKGAQVSGLLYQGLSRAQLAKLDAYEGEQYRRVRLWVNPEQGQCTQAWTYVLQPRCYHRLTGKAWSLERFRREQLPLYLHRSNNKLYGLHGRDTNQSA